MEAIPLLKKCLTEDSGHQRAINLLSKCQARVEPDKSKAGSKVNQITIKIERGQHRLPKEVTGPEFTARNERLQNGNQSSKRLTTPGNIAPPSVKRKEIVNLMVESSSPPHIRLIST